MKKILKIIFFCIVGLIMAGCLGILICALNPSLTAMLAEQVENLSSPGAGGAGGISGSGEARPGVNADWLEERDQTGYKLPADTSVEAPASVSGRTGYEPVRDEAEQIPQEEADSLTGAATPGETGSGLSFDAEFYPYYAMLESDMQQLYRQIYANALSMNASFTPVVEATLEQVKNVFEAVCNDHPELFWLETGYSCKYLRGGGCVEITLKYNETAARADEARQEFYAAADGILSQARNLSSNEEKEQYVHDALMGLASYDVSASMHQSAYSALVRGRSVCAGYSRAFQYLMQQLSIPCYYCTGYAGEDHAWNIVKLGDNYYNVDVTWDDTDTPTRDYFNKTDAEFAGTHVRTGLSVYLPACGAGESAADGGAGAGADETEGSTPAPVNPTPVEPMRWQSRNRTEDDNAAMTADERKRANLETAGITEEQVRDTMQEYYEDCRKLLKEVGTGDKQFSNVIPESLWSTVERAYGTGDYWKGYVEGALKDLGAENCAIQLQVQDLGGGYYRLYHNVYTY